MRLFRSFRARLLIGVLAPMLVVSAFATVYELRQVEEQFEQRLIVEGEALAASVNEPLVQAAWDFDTVQIINIAEGLVTTKTINSVSILDQAGNEMVVRTVSAYEPDPADVEQSYPLIHKTRTEAHPVGTLVLTLNYGEVRNAVREALLWRATMTGSVAVLIALINSAILVGLSRPLVAMAELIPRIGTPGFSDRIPALSQHDELGAVARALLTLQRNTDELNKLRALEDEESRREQRRIYHAVEATHDGVLIFDLDGTLAYSNPAAIRFFGRPEIGTAMVLPREFDTEVADTINAAVSTRQEIEVETKKIVTDETVYLSIRGRAIRDIDDTELGYSLIVQDETAHTLQAQETKYISEHDSLTGVANRRLFEDTLARYVDEVRDNFAVMIADLDNFKQVNDTLGHPVGDALIGHVARLITSKVGETELVARLGGDEFAIISRDSDPVGTLSRIADDLVTCLAAPQKVGQWVLTTGMSAGIAKYPSASDNPQEVTRRADLALYEAKNKGRGCFEVFEGDLEARLNRKTRLEMDLRRAIAEGQIRVDYQVQTDAQTGQIVGFEALARWKHAKLGHISPAEFIPIAEEINAIEDLTNKVLEDVCTNARQLEELGFKGRIAVNLSSKLIGAGLPELIDDMLFQTGCSPTSIEAEITESVILAPGPHARNDIAKLRDKQITVALDDFGMGYSSLSYLQHFPVDKLKIDRSFTQQICSKPEARAIIRAICEMGHALGLSVTAEGVEEAGQLDFLRRSGIDTCQGFIDGEPMKIDDILENYRSFKFQVANRI